MRKTIFPVIFGALLFSSTTLVTGCSLIGFGLGSSGDNGEPGTRVSEPDGLARLPLGTKLIVLMKDSTVVQGGFKGVSPAPDTISYANYQDEFERWRALSGHESFHLPPFGSAVQVVMNSGYATHANVGRFAGFDPVSIRLSTGAHDEITRFDVKSVREVRHSLGQITKRDELLQAFSEGVPLASGALQYKSVTVILLEVERYSAGPKNWGVEAQVVEIPVDEVRAVHLWEHSNDRWVGFGIGLVIDVAVATIAIVELSNLHFDWSKAKHY